MVSSSTLQRYSLVVAFAVAIAVLPVAIADAGPTALTSGIPDSEPAAAQSEATVPAATTDVEYGVSVDASVPRDGFGVPPRLDPGGDGVTEPAGAATVDGGSSTGASGENGPVDGTSRPQVGTATDWPSSLLTPGTVSGFVFGTLLSLLLVGGGTRLVRRVESAFARDALLSLGDAPGADSASSATRDDPSRSTGDDAPTSESSVGDETWTDAVSDDELLTDEARIRRLLETQRGRMKQSAIVEMTEWSKSKVSRVLSRMAENGDVLKIMLGRENLICLPGHEPDIAKSSLDG